MAGTTARYWSSGGAAILVLLAACEMRRPPAAPNQPSGLRPLGAPPSPSARHAPPSPQPAGPANALAPMALPPGVASFRPPGMHPTAPPGFWIWRNPHGTWRLRTTSGNQPRWFKGTIAGVTAPLSRAERARPSPDGEVRPIPGGVQFALSPSRMIDGVDFEVRDGGCVRFQLDLGDQGAPSAMITVGAIQAHPASPDFVLCP